ncbi:hypothetical protein [Variovorax sp. YR216]|uniref:hypothetical protein n=1 Tax=Variovorax sp. YR216 TaxID=1882828 RepID=UPI00089741AA|nr:hypothetical protein SAMN05444680_102493 [Variovorax sp. YR216]
MERNAIEFAQKAIARLVAFVPGFAESPGLATLRLSFATSNVEKIEECIARLGEVL